MYNMTIRLQEGESTLYEQIYNHIKNEIKDGKLLAGERLPSARSLAENLQISRSTVDFAYGQLLAEGYIEASPRRGYFVASVENIEGLAKVPQRQNGQNSSPVPPKTKNKGKDYIDLSPYSIDMQGFPFATWKKITKNVLTDANSEMFSKGEAQGDYDLRVTISRYLYSSRGVNCVPEQIVVGAGNDYLLMLLEKILNRKMTVAMENPTYLRPYRILKSFGYEMKLLPEGERFGSEWLERVGANAVYAMPSHQFPTGKVMPIGQRLELLKWAGSGEGRYIIEDDYDSEFRYYGKPIPALQASDEAGRVVYLGSFSKAIAPAIRISFMVLPMSLLEAFKEHCFFYSSTVSRIDQSILNVFIRDGFFERHLNKMRKSYRAKHEQLLEWLQGKVERFTVSGENAGLHLLVSCKDLTEQEMVARARDAGVKVYGVSEYMLEKKQDTSTVLLGFGELSPERLAEAIERLDRAWEKEDA